MEKISAPKIMEMKKEGKKIACLTSYDYLMTKILNEAGIDLILVGDSVGNVVLGYASTIPVTIDDIVYHTKAVAKANSRALLVADLPFLSFQINMNETVKNAGRCIKEGGAEAVKMEGGRIIADCVSRLTEIGIPVMGHLGLMPQSIHRYGGYQTRAKNKIEADQVKADAKIIEQAGAFAIVLEKIPANLAQEISESLSIPTIGIGAGPFCDGQILVSHDMLGLVEHFKPKFVRRYGELANMMRDAFTHYIDDVRTNTFPSLDESY